MVRKLIAMMLVALLMPAWVSAEGSSRPKVGLVLSGGGARGAAHVGVLRVLEELHVPIDYISGTSMGAIVGGLYALGMPLDELEAIATQTDWAAIFSDTLERRKQPYRLKDGPQNYFLTYEIDYEQGIRLPRGVLAGKRLDLMLRSLTLNTGEDFDEFPIPFRAVAADIETGAVKVFGRGDLARALRASMAIPGVFSPVEYEGVLLVDGGVVNNLPVDIVKQMGAERVIAVNIGTPLRDRDQLNDFLDITDQITNILTFRDVAVQMENLEANDLLIVPDLGDITSASFDRMHEAMEIGRRAAREVEDQLLRYAVDEEQYLAILRKQAARVRRPEVIDFVEVRQPSLVSSDFIRKRIEQRVQEVFDVDLFAYDVFEIYEQADFEDIDFELVENNNRQGLLIEAVEKTHPRHRVRFGVELADNFEGESFYLVLLDYTVTRVNRLGAQWKNEVWFGRTRRFFSEFYQPLDPYIWHVFLAPHAEYRIFPVDLYEGSSRVAQYEVQTRTGGIDLGLQMGEYGEIRFGALRGINRSSLDIGDPTLPETQYDNGAWKLSLDIDRLDSSALPRDGVKIETAFLAGRHALGSDNAYELLEIAALKPFTTGRHTLIASGR
ncbi:MAG: patatin-like phospholipase family protein, partial [Desulfomonilia bacterium]|nr:patatin-like phospholipase family protein [Desulfomonilia bacterium]